MPEHTCPICKKQFEYTRIEETPQFPFCSKRCRLIDLGKWIDEEYRVSDVDESLFNEDDEED